MTQSFDSILLGSSPLMLMCHNVLSQKENSLLIERNDRFGGAWYTGEKWGIQQLELGCHILKNYPKGASLLKDAGVKTAIMPLQPSVYYCGIKGESFLNTLKITTLKSFNLFRSNKLINKYRVDKLGSLNKSNDIGPYFYLEKGCYSLLTDLLNNSNNRKLNTSIQSVKVEDDVALIELSTGEKIKTKKLYVAKNFKVAELHINGKAISYKYDNYISEHLMFLLDKEMREFSFVDVVGDDLINLISNVGLYADTNGKGVLSMAIQRSSGKAENNLSISSFTNLPGQKEIEELAKTVEEKLRKFKILTSKYTVLDHHYEPYVLDVKLNRTDYDLTTLSRGVITEFDSSDLIDSMLKNPILNAN